MATTLYEAPAGCLPPAVVVATNVDSAQLRAVQGAGLRPEKLASVTALSGRWSCAHQ